MSLSEIKKEMINYKDFYGGDLLGVSDVVSAKSKTQLRDLIERHRTHLENMLSDALNHLDDFQRQVELSIF